MYRPMNPGIRPNALRDQFEWLRHDDVLFTHFSPHLVESGARGDLATVTTVFSDVFLPAGAG